MVTFDSVKTLIDPRKNKVLLFAEMALPKSQFLAFRKLFLDEFGKSGLESDLVRVFNEKSTYTGKVRHGQE